jgi:hypothetical protein
MSVILLAARHRSWCAHVSFDHLRSNRGVSAGRVSASRAWAARAQRSAGAAIGTPRVEAAA